MEYIGISEEEFYGIVAKNVIAPHVWDLQQVKALPRGEKLYDHDQWDRTRVD